MFMEWFFGGLKLDALSNFLTDTFTNYLKDGRIILVEELTLGLMSGVAASCSVQRDHIAQQPSKEIIAVVGTEYYLQTLLYRH